jgi:hypothetical protein
MKRATTTAMGLAALVAMLALGAFSAGSASAHEFLWTGPLPGLLLVLSTNTQVFEVVPGLFQVKCKHFIGHGILSNGSSMAIKTSKITGHYFECEVTGGSKAEISEVEYELNAEGTVGVIGKPIVISALGAAKCSVKVNNGAPNNKLSSLTFLNLSSDLLVHVNVSKITSLGSGGVCGTAGVEQTEGTYVGLLLSLVDSGTLQWD